MDHNKIFCSLNMVKSIWELITIVDHHLVEHRDVGSVLWGWGHNNFLYRYAIEGVSFACKWAYRGATPGSFLSGTNISSTSLLLSLLRMLQCVTSISSFSICLHNIVLIICKRVKEELHSIISTTKWLQFNSVSRYHVADAYYLSRLPIVERRLAQGGIRLASILNSIFDPEAPQRSLVHKPV